MTEVVIQKPSNIQEVEYRDLPAKSYFLHKGQLFYKTHGNTRRPIGIEDNMQQRFYVNEKDKVTPVRKVVLGYFL